jgi:hypothetical protein
VPRGSATALDLHPELALDLLRRDGAILDEQIDNVGVGAAIRAFRPSGLEIVLADLARLQQRHLQRHGLGAHVRVHDTPRVEVDDTFVVTELGSDAQHTCLPAEIEQLEDIVDTELA